MNNIRTKIAETKGIYKILLAVLFGAVIIQGVVLTWINLTQMQNHMGFDASSYYLKAYEMWKQGTIFIDNWVDQTTLYYDAAVPLAALLMNVFHNIFIAYGVANLIVDAFIVFLVVKILGEYKSSLLTKLIVVNIVLCPFIPVKFNNANDVSYFSSILTSGSWYGVKLALSLLFIWNWMLIKKEDNIWKNRKVLLLSVITCILYFISGVSSGYYLGVTIILPAIFVGSVVMFKENSMRELKSWEMIFCYINLGMIFIGKFIATHVLNFVSKDSNMVWVGMQDFFKNIGSIFLGYVGLLQGLPTTSDKMILDSNGLMYAIGLGIVFITLLGFIMLVRNLLKKYDEYKNYLLPVLVVVVNFLIFSLSYTTYGSAIFEERYLIIPFFAVIICMTAWIDSLDDKLLLKQIGCMLLIGLVSLQSARCYSQYITNKEDVNKMERIKQVVAEIDTPVVYIYGANSEYDILTRDMRVFDTDKVYKILTLSENGTVEKPHWGDYTYYDYQSEWNGKTVLCTNQEGFEKIPESIKENYTEINRVDELIVYISDTNVLGK